MKQGSTRMLIMSTLYVLSACFLLSITTYAWFIMTNTTKTSLVSAISEVEAEYDFYIYQDSWHDGNENPLLSEQLCDREDDDGCYQLIQDPSHVFDWMQSIAPGERFSFAISIVSIGTEAYLSLDMGHIESFGYTDPSLQIKYAFFYEITKLSYIVSGVEGLDQKDVSPTTRFQGYFNQADDAIYPLIHDIPLNHIQGEHVVIVVYFDLYYDPSVIYRDEYGIPFDNLNHLMGQSLAIEDIYMMISSSLD